MDAPDNLAPLGLTFDDVLLLPAASDVVPGEVDTSTRFSRNIKLRVPLVSSAMDSVTEARLAIAMARHGGVGVLHRNLPIEEQAQQVDLVKRSEAGMVSHPVTVGPDVTLGEVDALCARYRVSGLPVTDPDGLLLGIVTNRDLRFETDRGRMARDVMTPMPLVTGPVGIRGEDAMALLRQHKIEKLPLVDEGGRLRGLITVKDFVKAEQYPTATKDPQGRLVVGAAIGVGVDAYDRALALVDAGVDALVVDTAHGHSRAVLDMVAKCKANFGVDVVGGNVATREGAQALIDAGADGVKVGVGPGCLGAGTRILMADATYRNIEDVRPGDRVINMHGAAVTVLKSWCTGVRDVIALRHTLSGAATVVTSDHRFFVGDLSTLSQATITSRGYARALAGPTKRGESQLGWQPIGQVGRAVGLVPRFIEFDMPEHFGVDLRDFAVRKGMLARYNLDIKDSYDLGFIFGTFLGDGHAFLNRWNTGEFGNSAWSFGLGEEDVAEKLSSAIERVIGFRPKMLRVKNTIVVRVYSLQWTRLLAQFGKRSEKHLPAAYLCRNPDYLEGLRDGLLASDGYVETGGRECFRNTSPRLVELWGVLTVLTRGSFPSVNRELGSPGGLRADPARCLPSYRSRLDATHEKRHLDDLQCVKVLAREELPEAVPVYDLEVDCPTHSFIADNVVVHNSICTTRVVAGVGVPQVTAINEAAKAAGPAGVPVIGDGGLQYSGDIAKAIVAGADTVMLGSLLAGCEESPGELIFSGGKQFKSYRGMGSLGALQSRGETESFSKDRYSQDDVLSDDKLVPEGIEGQVPYRGPLSAVAHQLIGGLRAAMGYSGAGSVTELKERGRFVRITSAGLKESHPHDVRMTVEAPNYHSR